MLSLFEVKGLNKDRFGRYYSEHNMGHRLWTVFTKDQYCKRGEYCEEIDVFADTPGQAKKFVQMILDEHYDPELRIARVEMVF